MAEPFWCNLSPEFVLDMHISIIIPEFIYLHQHPNK